MWRRRPTDVVPVSKHVGVLLLTSLSLPLEHELKASRHPSEDRPGRRARGQALLPIEGRPYVVACAAVGDLCIGLRIPLYGDGRELADCRTLDRLAAVAVEGQKDVDVDLPRVRYRVDEAASDGRHCVCGGKRLRRECAERDSVRLVPPQAHRGAERDTAPPSFLPFEMVYSPCSKILGSPTLTKARRPRRGSSDAEEAARRTSNAVSADTGAPCVGGGCTIRKRLARECAERDLSVPVTSG